jgi:hypothetical protein
MLSTVALQQPATGDGSRRPCRKAHLCVVLADNNHRFFEYQPKHTSKSVAIDQTSSSQALSFIALAENHTLRDFAFSRRVHGHIITECRGKTSIL